MINQFGHDPARRGMRFWTLVAWALIIAIGGTKIVFLVINSLGLSEAESAKSVGVSINAELIGKIVVGGIGLSPESSELFLVQAEPLREGSLGDRLAFVMLTAEVREPEAAQAMLDDESLFPPDEAETLTEAEARFLELVEMIVSDRNAGDSDLASLGEDDRAELLRLAGWIGRLALLPPETTDQDARKSLLASLAILPFAFGGVIGTLLLLGFVGVILLIILGVHANDGRALHGFRPSPEGSHGIYLETFALWTTLFLGAQLLLGELNARGVIPAGFSLPCSLAVFFGSLLVLIWPVICGLSWRQVREDIGWTSGRGILRELGAGGVGGYAMALPIVGIGFVITVGLTHLQTVYMPNAPAPSHPAQQLASSGDFWVILQLYILACVAAPLVEETMFRGVLYRYFREVSRTWRLAGAFLFSAMATSFFFAAVHPQGIVAIPVLMSLAIGFCLIREWRGALPGAMVAHGINNFLIISLNVALFGSG